MAGAHPHYRSVRSTSPVILKHDTGSSGNGWEDVAGRRASHAPESGPKLNALRAPLAVPRRIGASPSGKAADFDSAIRRFESSRPSHAFADLATSL